VELRLRAVDQFYLQRPMDPRMRHLFGIRIVLLQIVEGCSQFAQHYAKYGQPERDRPLELNIDSINYEHPIELDSSPAFVSPRASHLTPKRTAQKQKYLQQESAPSHHSQATHLPDFKTQRQPPPPPPDKPSGGMRLSDLRKPTLRNKSKSPKKALGQQGLPKKGTAKKVEVGPVKRQEDRNEEVAHYERERE
jgi:hypothetical protein